MICFEEDWAKYPTAQPDWDTPNRSFVRAAGLLKKMGVRNNTWMLALVNQDLKGVDPHDPNLTLNQKVAVAIECKINPWYFFREVCKAPVPGSSESGPVEANRGNLALWWCFFCHITIILIQIRQTGKSFSTDALMVLLMEIVCYNTQINLLTKDDTLRRANVERMKAIIADLPPYLNQKRFDDASNTEEITVRALKNVYKTHVPQSSAKRAYNMGRGLTSPIFQIDEAPFQPNIEIALPAALAATGAAIDAARKAGTPYGIIMTTTAGMKDDKDGAYIYSMVCDAAQWTEKFFDAKNQDELEALVRNSSRNKEAMVVATFNHRQLGKTDEWLKDKLEKSRARGEDANRDYFNVWTSGSQTSPLPLYILETMARAVKDVLHAEISRPYSYITRWYIPENEIESRMKGGRFVMGMDTSEAVGRDEISLVLMDVETLEVVAAGSYNETNLITFSEWLCSFMVKYENVTAVIERKSSGGYILDYLMVNMVKLGIDPFKRIFNWVTSDTGGNKERFREVAVAMNRRNHDVYTRYRKLFGFATTGGDGPQSRSELYSTSLQNGAKLAADRMNDKKLIDQTMGLITKNGRVDHPDGEHDDMTIGWLLCYWFLSQATNLVHYGIDPSRVMSRVGKSSTKSEEEVLIEEEQAEYRERMEVLYERLVNERDEFVASKIEQELRLLNSRLILDTTETFSVDQLIRNAKEERWNKKRTSRVLTDDDRGFRQPTMSEVHREQHGYFSDNPYAHNPRRYNY
jgi:hypothetical protein